MDTCRNKITKKTFLLVDYLDDDRALMITPTGEIKTLETKLFDDFKTDRDPRKLLKSGEINLRQVERYNRVKEST